MRFDRKKFFDGVKARLDSSLTQEQVDGFNFLLDQIEKETLWSSIPLIAYGLATAWHETNHSMQPVEEGYYLAVYGKTRVKSFQKTLRYFPFFGRGYVQLTWETKRIPNYSKATRELRAQRSELVAAFEKKTGQNFDLVKHPEQALDPLIAFGVMTLGMFEGWFTGKKITDFIHGNVKNYTDARTVINGNDKAGAIAAHAVRFESILQKSLFLGNDPGPAPADEQPEPPEPTGGEGPSTDDGSGQQAPASDGTGSEAVETPVSGMPKPAAPPKVTQQTPDVQVSEDGTTAVSANTSVGGMKWLMTAIVAIITGQATVPEFVQNGLQSTNFWTVVLNIFANLWAFKVYIIGGILFIFFVRKIEAIVLKVVAMHINADPAKGNAVLTQPAPTDWFKFVRKRFGV